MKSSNKIAVVIVNWNSGEYLDQCLRNLKGQTLLPDRVLVVDNASTDGSMNGLAERFQILDFVSLPRGIRPKSDGGVRDGDWEGGS